MAEDWSRAEVEATVADYFDMLEKEVQGLAFNKSAHRRFLSKLLARRTDGAIERKHQNISAVLLDLGFVPIAGYKRLGNYQHLLMEVVADRLARSQRLVDIVRRQVAEPAPVPSVDDILASLVDPPSPDPAPPTYDANVLRERQGLRRGIDYLAIEASNRSLGSAGEEFVVQFEIARLLKDGCDRLASQVERVSETRGDGLGYDVLSFETSGRERLIEVKTTRYGASTPFFVSRNELAVSRDEADQFQLYRAFDFRRRPRIFCKAGAIEQAFRLEPSQFVASVT